MIERFREVHKMNTMKNKYLKQSKQLLINQHHQQQVDQQEIFKQIKVRVKDKQGQTEDQFLTSLLQDIKSKQIKQKIERIKAELTLAAKPEFQPIFKNKEKALEKYHAQQTRLEGNLLKLDGKMQLIKQKLENKSRKERNSQAGMQGKFESLQTPP